MSFLARVYVTLKPDVLDPQGEAVRDAMASLGLRADSVRIGKLIEIELPKDLAPAEAQAKLELICDKLLANTIIENSTFEVL